MEKKCNHPTNEDIFKTNRRILFYSEVLPKITCKNCFKKKSNRSWGHSEKYFRVTFDFHEKDSHRAIELIQMYEHFDSKIRDFESVCMGRLGGASFGFLNEDSRRIVRELQDGFKRTFEKGNE